MEGEFKFQSALDALKAELMEAEKLREELDRKIIGLRQSVSGLLRLRDASLDDEPPPLSPIQEMMIDAHQDAVEMFGVKHADAEDELVVAPGPHGAAHLDCQQVVLPLHPSNCSPCRANGQLAPQLECLLVAPNGHRCGNGRCPLSGAKRTWPGRQPMSPIDPGRVETSFVPQ